MRASSVLEISVLLTLRGAALGAVHAADAIAAYRRRATTLSRSFRFGIAARGFVSALHGVVAYFSTTPTSARTKHRDRPYRGGRQKHWIKLKNRNHAAMYRVKEAFADQASRSSGRLNSKIV